MSAQGTTNETAAGAAEDAPADVSYGKITNSAEERSAKFSADIDAIDRMSPDECRAELRRLYRDQRAPSVIHAAAVAALASDMARNRERRFDGKSRNWCGGCPFPEGCVVCELPSRGA